MQTAATTQSPRFTWRDAPDLIARLTTAQNHPRFDHQDIMTFAGFFTSREELERHVVAKEAGAAAYDARHRVSA
jgi:hypothetical protein